MHRQAALVLVIAASSLAAAGCFLDRTPFGVPRDGGQSGLDASTRDAATDGFVPPGDAQRDSGPCVPTSPPTDVCDGRDNDCSSATPDGVDDPMRGQACDDDDADRCMDGTLGCVGGALVCVGEDGTDELDLCNGDDDDCDPSTADGSAEPTIGDPCDGLDSDVCAEGFIVCASGTLGCSDESDDTEEECNRADDDCDGAIDEISGCTCRWGTFEGHGYLFCNETRSWSDARGRCPAGFDLAQVHSRAEHDFVQGTARDINNGDWWLGATRTMPPSADGTTLTWLDGSPVPLPAATSGFSNWRGGEPNDSGGCLDMDPDQNSASGVPGRWDDDSCTATNRYVCESLP